MSHEDSSIDKWICLSMCQLWVLSCLQEVLEATVHSYLLPKFHSMYQCRPGVTDTMFCHVRDVASALVLKFPMDECVYDAWCGRVVLRSSRAPMVTRFTVLWAGLGVSIGIIWAPRLLIYRPKNSITAWIKRNTPRRILTFVLCAALLQIFIDHSIQPLILPEQDILSAGASIRSFMIAMFITTLTLLFLCLRNQNKHYQSYTLTEGSSSSNFAGGLQSHTAVLEPV